MAGFVFEKDLPHQTRAVTGVLSAFEGITFSQTKIGTQNPLIELAASENLLRDNLESLRKARGFQQVYKLDAKEHIFDISMETGTGKTYAYTKTMFELNKQTGLAKFIVAVPRVAIKAGTVSFLKSDSAREHFRDTYGRDIKVYEVQSQKNTKSKKDHIPQAIADFCRADVSMNKNAIHVLVINAGMITAKKTLKAEGGNFSVRTLDWKHDVSLFDEFHTPNEAIVHTRPVLIVDEPHMFKRGNATYKAMMKFEPQFVLRYGATFDGDLINMVNELTAVEAFNEDLVKGINAFVETFPDAKGASVKLTTIEKDYASFEVRDAKRKEVVRVGNGESLANVHANFGTLSIAKIAKSKLIELDDGTIWAKAEVHNPYSFAETLQDTMMQNAIRAHFDTERELFLAQPRIKPLALFFIENIHSYRPEDGTEGHLKARFETMLKGHIEALISTETDDAYRAHLTLALKDITALHGGYFSKDNASKDKQDADIERQTLEILHEKEALLDFANPRRFIFSKWTLREGWDNPNVFTICKLRSSGSETSKLQEVGRGLRLPVNEFWSRDKSKTYFLNYFVDFTEADFAKKLVDEINRVGEVQFDLKKLDAVLIERLLAAYSEFNGDEDTLLEKLFADGIIKMSHAYKDDGFETLKASYPDAFGQSLKKNKVKSGGLVKTKATIRAGKYAELKELWEKLNRKVVLEYKFEQGISLGQLFSEYLNANKDSFGQTGVVTKVFKVEGLDGLVASTEVVTAVKFEPIKMMTYQAFLTELSVAVALSVSTLHCAFVKLKKNGFDISQYLSQSTIRRLKAGYNEFLMQSVFGKFKIGYQETSNAVHPTKFSTPNGDPLGEIHSGEIGVLFEEGKAPPAYLFNEIYYDGMSGLERDNIVTSVAEVIVYTKIPKNSIRIPLVGGGSYSPDFAYLIKQIDGSQALSLVVESKSKDEGDLSANEAKKISHAEQFFNSGGQNLRVKFETQLKGEQISDIIHQALSS